MHLHFYENFYLRMRIGTYTEENILFMLSDPKMPENIRFFKENMLPTFYPEFYNKYKALIYEN